MTLRHAFYTIVGAVAAFGLSTVAKALWEDWRGQRRGYY